MSTPTTLLRVRIAGHTIGILSNNPGTPKLFSHFIAEDDGTEPECVISVPKDEIEKRRADGFPRPYFLIMHDHISRWLLTQDVLHVHASTLICQGKAFLFTAPSGTGKSTHTRLWEQVFGSEVKMINDDKPFVHVEKSGESTAYGSPWNGKHDIGNNASAPVGGICFLKQGKKNVIRKLEREEAFFLLLQQVYIWDNFQDTQTILTLITKFLEKTPVWQLECTPTLEAAQLAHDTMIAQS